MTNHPYNLRWYNNIQVKLPKKVICKHRRTNQRTSQRTNEQSNKHTSITLHFMSHIQLESISNSVGLCMCLQTAFTTTINYRQQFTA